MKVKNKLSVSNERLRIVGKLIGVYREERRDNSQNCWTQKRFCKDICSPNTLKSIEAGGLARSLDVYMEMLDKLDLKLGEFPEIDKAIYKLTEKLYEAIEDYRLEDIITIIDKALRVLKEVREYIYYGELYKLFENIKKHYGVKVMIDDDVAVKYKLFIYIFPHEYKDLFMFLAYAKIKANGILDKEFYNRIVKEIDLNNCNHEFMKANLIDYYYITGYYKKMECLINELVDSFQKNKKIIRLLDVYNYAIVLFSEVEFEKCLQYIEYSEILLKTNIIPAVKKSELFSNIAYAFHLNEKYRDALNYYNKIFKQEHHDYIDSYIFMADCQNRLNIPVEIPLVDEKVYIQYPNDVKRMYKYFTLDKTIPDFARENYILKKIAPLLTDIEFIKVFRFEILKLVKKTGHYKCTHLFESVVEENGKNKVDVFQ